MDQRFGLKGFVHITAAVVVIIIIIIIIIIRIQAAAAAAAAAECYEHIVDAAATHRSTLPDVDAQCDKLAHYSPVDAAAARRPAPAAATPSPGRTGLRDHAPSCRSTDSERPHRCCHRPNNVENIGRTPVILYPVVSGPDLAGGRPAVAQLNCGSLDRRL